MPRKAVAAVRRPRAASFELADPSVEFRVVLLTDIVESPLNPRRRKPALDPGFLASIARQGVIEPVVLRRSDDPMVTGAQYELVAGEQRVRACREVGRLDVPATIRQVTDEEVIELALAENIHRRAMHPIDEAHALDKLRTLDRAYQDLDALAAKVGRSASYVRDRLKLLRLDPVVVEALDANAITTKHAELIAALAPDQHVAALAACFPPLLAESDGVEVEVGQAITERAWSTLEPALGGTRALADWCKTHGKADLTDPAVQQQLREDVLEGANADDLEDDPELAEKQVAQALEEATASLLQLSTVAGLDRATRKALGVIGPEDYKLITRAKDKCDATKRAAIIHGPAATERGVELVEACVDKRGCTQHWAKEQRAAKRAKTAQRDPAAAAKERARQDTQQQKTEAERVAWERDAKPWGLALGRLIARARLTPMAVAQELSGPADRKRASEMFGFELTPKTALAGILLFRGFGNYNRDALLSTAERFGITRKQLAREVATAAPQAMKPARATKGGRKK